LAGFFRTAPSGTPRLFERFQPRFGKLDQVEWSLQMSAGTILLIILIIILVGALPTWPYSSGWGYYPSGGLGLVVVILLILVLMGRL
jgi:hypothetical protein